MGEKSNKMNAIVLKRKIDARSRRQRHDYHLLYQMSHYFDWLPRMADQCICACATGPPGMRTDRHDGLLPAYWWGLCKATESAHFDRLVGFS